MKDFRIIYCWDDDSKEHKFFDYYKINFIRDDERFTDKKYHEIFEKKHNCKFPACLEFMNLTLQSRDEVIEITDGLTKFFGEEERLMDFANWLRKTLNYVERYEFR